MFQFCIFLALHTLKRIEFNCLCWCPCWQFRLLYFVCHLLGLNKSSNVFTDLQAGCCKPSDDCGFTYVNPTNWNNNGTTSSSNPDCSAWENDAKVLCFNCQSCKAGLLDNIKSNWKKTAVVNIVFLIFLIIVYSVGCCAFRNTRRDNEYWKH